HVTSTSRGPSPARRSAFRHPRTSGRCPMKEFATSQIRNVALVAHHGVGKTSLAEAMLFLAKATTRLGRISDGTTLLDHAADEIHRQITINLGLAQFEWSGHKINLIDTPGFLDFVGDVHSAL